MGWDSVAGADGELYGDLCTKKPALAGFFAIPIGAASLVLFFTLFLGLFCFSLWLRLSFGG